MSNLASSNLNTTNQGTTQSNLPSWYTNYLQQFLGTGESEVANNIQNPPSFGFAPRVAGFTDAQNQAFQQVQNMQGSQSPQFQSAINNTNAATQNSPLTAAQPFLNAATNGQYSNQGAGLLGQAGATNVTGGVQNYLNQGSGLAQQGASTNLLGLASPYINQAVNSGGLQAAQPYLNAASGSLSDATNQAVSPYLNGALQSLANQSNLQLQQQILPSVQNQFISAGQFGSTRDQDVTTQAINNQQQTLQNSQASLLNQGYGQAQQAAGQNLALQGQLAGTAGQLGTAQQQAELAAGSTLGTLGGAQGGLQLQGASTLGGLGSIYGNTGIAQGQLQAQAGTGLGNIGYQQGSLNLGAANAAGNYQNAYNSTLLGAGNQMAGIGTAAQNANLQQIGALSAVGQQQQGLNQQNLNTQYADQSGQYYFPEQQTGYLASLVTGQPQNPAGSGTTTTSSNVVNPAAQVVGNVLGISGALSGQQPTAAKKGGAIRRVYRRGGRVSGSPKYKRAA